MREIKQYARNIKNNNVKIRKNIKTFMDKVSQEVIETNVFPKFIKGSIKTKEALTGNEEILIEKHDNK